MIKGELLSKLEDKTMISFVHKGDLGKITRFLNKVKRLNIQSILEKYGRYGVEVLSIATPVASGKTAESWGYEIDISDNYYAIYWTNSNVNKGYNIAILLNYGHGTGTGGYVEGRPFISPAIRPVFEAMADAAWKEVTSA